MILLEPSIYPKASPRILNYWPRLKDSVYGNADLNKRRYMLTEQYATKAITFVRSLIDRISEPYFLTTDDEFDLYNKYVLPESLVIARQIDPLSGATFDKNRFVSGNETKELILPTFGLIPSAITIYSDWDDWEEIAPIRILNHDSKELNLAFHNGQIDFKKDQPTFAVFAVDVPALLWKYIKYIKENDYSFESVDRDAFISKHIIPFFYDQLVDIWLLKIVRECYIDPTTNETDLFITNNYATNSSIIKSGVREMNHIIDMLGVNVVSLGAFLSTEILDDKSLLDCIDIYGTQYTISNSRRYLGYEILKSYNLIDLLFQSVKAQAGRNIVTNIVRKMEFEYKSIRRSSWQSHIRDTEITKQINFLFREIEEFLD